MTDEKKNKADAEESGGTPAWMVTFSDLATLLLTFFVLLLSMSAMDERCSIVLWRKEVASYTKNAAEATRRATVLIVMMISNSLVLIDMFLSARMLLPALGAPISNYLCELQKF